VVVPRVSTTSAPNWLVWLALATIYVVWGSTYLGIRVVVETMPPLISGGVRFMAAGAIVYAVLLARRGPAAVRFSRDELIGSAFVGSALVAGGNGIVMVAEQDVPSGLAALIMASIPLWVILMRRVSGERIAGGTLAGVAVGFVGVALLVMPGGGGEHAKLGGLLLLILAAFFWSLGTFYSKRVILPRDPFLSTAVQMIAGGAVSLAAGFALGEAGDVRFSSFSGDSILAFVYLVLIGSIVAFTAYVWVLQHAPVSTVSTYAFVNPVIAVFLGWLILDEAVTMTILVAAAIIVSSVAVIVRREAGEPPAEETVPEPAAGAKPAQARARRSGAAA
jgi:drug/metabolite transporter (DMT)-like permease